MTELDPTLDRSERPIECCRVAANMTREQLRDQRYVEHCKVCGRRHWVAEVDPIEFGLTGASL